MSPPELNEGGPPFRLRRTARKVALTAHVLGSVGWFGVALAVALAVIAASVTGDAELEHTLYDTLRYAPVLSVPLGLSGIVTGAVLGLGTPHGLIRHWWVVVKIALAVAVVITDAAIVGAAAHHAASTGTTPRPLAGATGAHVVVLVAATVLSVFKPGGRTPWASALTREASP